MSRRTSRRAVPVVLATIALVALVGVVVVVAGQEDATSETEAQGPNRLDQISVRRVSMGTSVPALYGPGLRRVGGTLMTTFLAASDGSGAVSLDFGRTWIASRTPGDPELLGIEAATEVDGSIFAFGGLGDRVGPDADGRIPPSIWISRDEGRSFEGSSGVTGPGWRNGGVRAVVEVEGRPVALGHVRILDASAPDGSSDVAVRWDTDDGGRSWSPTPIDDIGTDANAFGRSTLVVGGRTIVTAGTDRAWRSTDGGQSWADVDVRPRDDLRLSPTLSEVGDQLVLAATPVTVASDDGGETWQPLGTPPAVIGLKGQPPVESYLMPELVEVGETALIGRARHRYRQEGFDTREDHLVRSENGGRTWTRATEPFTCPERQADSVVVEGPVRLGTALVATFGCNLGDIGSWGRLFVSVDDGRTWILHPDLSIDELLSRPVVAADGAVVVVGIHVEDQLYETNLVYRVTVDE